MNKQEFLAAFAAKKDGGFFQYEQKPQDEQDEKKGSKSHEDQTPSGIKFYLERTPENLQKIGAVMAELVDSVSWSGEKTDLAKHLAASGFKIQLLTPTTELENLQPLTHEVIITIPHKVGQKGLKNFGLALMKCFELAGVEYRVGVSCGDADMPFPVYYSTAPGSEPAIECTWPFVSFPPVNTSEHYIAWQDFQSRGVHPSPYATQTIRSLYQKREEESITKVREEFEKNRVKWAKEVAAQVVACTEAKIAFQKKHPSKEEIAAPCDYFPSLNNDLLKLEEFFSRPYLWVEPSEKMYKQVAELITQVQKFYPKDWGRGKQVGWRESQDIQELGDLWSKEKTIENLSALVAVVQRLKTALPNKTQTLKEQFLDNRDMRAFLNASGFSVDDQSTAALEHTITVQPGSLQYYLRSLDSASDGLILAKTLASLTVRKEALAEAGKEAVIPFGSDFNPATAKEQFEASFHAIQVAFDPEFLTDDTLEGRLSIVEAVNQRQERLVAEMIRHHYPFLMVLELCLKMRQEQLSSELSRMIREERPNILQQMREFCHVGEESAISLLQKVVGRVSEECLSDIVKKLQIDFNERGLLCDPERASVIVSRILNIQDSAFKGHGRSLSLYLGNLAFAQFRTQQQLPKFYDRIEQHYGETSELFRNLAQFYSEKLADDVPQKHAYLREERLACLNDLYQTAQMTSENRDQYVYNLLKIRPDSGELGKFWDSRLRRPFKALTLVTDYGLQEAKWVTRIQCIYGVGADRAKQILELHYQRLLSERIASGENTFAEKAAKITLATIKAHFPKGKSELRSSVLQWIAFGERFSRLSPLIVLAEIIRLAREDKSQKGAFFDALRKMPLSSEQAEEHLLKEANKSRTVLCEEEFLRALVSIYFGKGTPQQKNDISKHLKGDYTFNDLQKPSLSSSALFMKELEELLAELKGDAIHGNAWFRLLFIFQKIDVTKLKQGSPEFHCYTTLAVYFADVEKAMARIVGNEEVDVLRQVLNPQLAAAPNLETSVVLEEAQAAEVPELDAKHVPEILARGGVDDTAAIYAALAAAQSNTAVASFAALNSSEMSSAFPPSSVPLALSVSPAAMLPVEHDLVAEAVVGDSDQEFEGEVLSDDAAAERELAELLGVQGPQIGERASGTYAAIAVALDDREELVPLPARQLVSEADSEEHETPSRPPSPLLALIPLPIPTNPAVSQIRSVKDRGPLGPAALALVAELQQQQQEQQQQQQEDPRRSPSPGSR